MLPLFRFQNSVIKKWVTIFKGVGVGEHEAQAEAGLFQRRVVSRGAFLVHGAIQVESETEEKLRSRRLDPNEEEV